MGNAQRRPPPVVLVPPAINRPHQLASRSRMTRSSYDVLFSKIAREHLFSDYYGEAELMMRIMLKPPEDPNVDVVVTMLKPFEESEAAPAAAAAFHWQRDALNPNTFVEFNMNTSTKVFTAQVCAFNPELGVGAFCAFPVITKNRLLLKNKHIVGLRYGSHHLSFGSAVDLVCRDPESFWLVGRCGKITAGWQYKPSVFGAEQKSWKEHQIAMLQNPENWSFAVDYGSGKESLLNPSFNFCLEFKNYSKIIMSYYHHLVVQRQVKNPFEGEEVIAITNYIDVGFEVGQELEAESDKQLAAFRIGGSWQANKNWLLKGKLGILSSAVALVFKSWWQPTFTLSLGVTRDHKQKQTKYGLGLQIENFGGASYERADPNYVMITPSKEHSAEQLLKHIKQRPIMERDVSDGHYHNVPADFRPPPATL